MINRYLSEKLRLVSFFSMIMVVFLHSYNLGEDIIYDSSYTKNLVFFVQFFISQGIARVAVPIFFCISGYLFFVNKEITFSVYGLLLKKRFKTLVLPYLFWSFLGFLIYFLLQVLPQTSIFFKQKHFVDYTVSEVLNTIFINPVPFQFWFIRDLIVFALFLPLIYLFVKYLKHFGLLLLLITWCIQFDFVFFSNEAILFFVFGAFFGVNKMDLENKLLCNYGYFFIMVWILFIFSETILICYNFNEIIIIKFIHKIGILIGVFAIWYFYDFILKKTEYSKSKFDTLTYFSFFLCAAHEPLLEFIKILFYKILGKSQNSLMFIYAISPIIVISICTVLGIFLKRTSPKVFAIITGGR